MDIWVATGNADKLKEINLILSSKIPNLKLFHQGQISGFTPRPEDGKTFLDNARIKARTLKSVKQNDWVLADDSGLEVAGLGNLPGVHSARYAGPHARDSENTTKLLKMMTLKSVTDRSAKFHCTIVVYTPQNEEWVFEADFLGKIAKTPVGLHGFGYDPVFIPEGQTQTLAELGPGYKNLHCHRSQCLRKFIEKLVV